MPQASSEIGIRDLETPTHQKRHISSVYEMPSFIVTTLFLKS
jgi:hypothetical protein